MSPERLSKLRTIGVTAVVTFVATILGVMSYHTHMKNQAPPDTPDCTAEVDHRCLVSTGVVTP